MEYLIGLLIGFSIGLTGVGAGIITTPILIALFNVEPSVAVGTALVFSTFIKAYTGFLYLLKGFWTKDILLLLLIGGVPGVTAGSLLTKYLPLSREDITVLLGLIILLSSWMNLYFMIRKIRPRTLSGRRRFLIPLLSLPIGVEVGFSSVGAGVLVELLLLSFTALSVQRIVGTSLIFGFILSLLGGSVHVGLGNVNTHVLPGLLLGGGLGAFIASKIIGFLPQNVLRYTLLSFLIILGSFLILKGLTFLDLKNLFQGG